MKRALFHAILTHNGTTARIVPHDTPNLSQSAWEQLGGILKRQADGTLKGEIHVSILIEEKDCGVQQNDRGYYWSTVVPEIKRGANYFGNAWTNADTHEHLKEQFIEPNEKGIRSTSGLGERGFRDYIEKCVQWAAEDLHITIPSRRRPGGFPEVEV